MLIYYLVCFNVSDKSQSLKKYGCFIILLTKFIHHNHLSFFCTLAYGKENIIFPK